MRVSGQNSDLFKRDVDGPVFVYLDVVNDSNNFNQCAVGFNPTSTNGFDVDSDSPKGSSGSAVYLASYIDSIPYTINAFELLNEYETKTIPLVLSTTNAGSHTFSISRYQNIGDEVSVYLMDNLTGTQSNLKLGDYSVTLAIGEYKTRFELMFVNTGIPLGVNDVLTEEIGVHAFQNANEIWVNAESNDLTIESVVVYDVLGKEMMVINATHSNLIKLDATALESGVYFVKTSMTDGSVTSEKVMYVQ
jgi:hypothetical protein